MRSLSLVVPVYNGENFIKESLEAYSQALSKKFRNLEIIVVCNACTDRTEQICNSLTTLPLKVINLTKRGKGNAIIEGFKYASGEIIGFLDADNPYDLDKVLEMIEHLNFYDMIIVTKFASFSKYQTNFTRRFFSLAGALVFKFLFGVRFKDTQAGAKFLRRDLFNKLKKPFLCTGFEFDMELLYKASKVNAKIKEFYIPPNETDFTTVKARILPGIVYRLLKLRLSK